MAKVKTKNFLEDRLMVLGAVIFGVGVILGGVGVGYSVMRALEVTSGEPTELSAPRTAGSQKSTQGKSTDASKPAGVDSEYLNQMNDLAILANILSLSQNAGDKADADVIAAWQSMLEELGTNRGSFDPALGFDFDAHQADFGAMVDELTTPPIKARIVTIMRTSLADARIGVIKAVGEAAEKAQNAERPGVVADKVADLVDRLIAAKNSVDREEIMNQIMNVLTQYDIKGKLRDRVEDRLAELRARAEAWDPGQIKDRIVAYVSTLPELDKDQREKLRTWAEQKTAEIDVKGTIEEVDIQDIRDWLEQQKIRGAVADTIENLFALLVAVRDAYDPGMVLHNIRILIDERPQVDPATKERIWNAVYNVAQAGKNGKNAVEVAVNNLQKELNEAGWPGKGRDMIIAYAKRLAEVVKNYDYGSVVAKMHAWTKATRQEVASEIMEMYAQMKEFRATHDYDEQSRQAVEDGVDKILLAAEKGAKQAVAAIKEFRKALEDSEYPELAIEKMVNAAERMAAEAKEWKENEKRIVKYGKMLVNYLKAVDLKTQVADAKEAANELASDVMAQVEEVKRSCSDTDPKFGDWAGDPSKYGWLEYTRLNTDVSKKKSADYCSGKTLFQAICSGYDMGFVCSNSCVTQDAGKTTAVCK